MDTLAAARAWAGAWERAWTTHDPDLVAPLYAEDAIFRSAPFRNPHIGRAGVHAYVEWAFADEGHADVRFAEPFQAGSGRAVVEYWAVTSTGGREETLAGVSLLDFRPDGRVTAQRDYWHLEEGCHDRQAHWGGSPTP